jgi:hypothetical protein
MENLQEQTLEQVWENLDRDDRDSLCAELRMIFDNLRQLEQKPTDPLIGKSLFQDSIPWITLSNTSSAYL